MASIVITINGEDKTRNVETNSLQIDNILTRQTDRCKLSVYKVKDGTLLNYTPNIGREVVITRDGTKVFAGLITRVTQSLNTTGVLIYDLDLEDYTRSLDRRLVPDTYSEMTVSEIIESMIANYTSASDGITTTNVDCDTTIDYIAFNYLPISKCLTQLADTVNYDWYIDYDKDIHFFAKDSNPAPVELEDDTATYLINTLKIRRDNSQLRNVIYVRGGEYLGSTFTTEVEANGIDSIYPLGYKYDGLSVTLTGQSLNVGVDNLDDEDDYDVLWNFQEKIIKFRDSRIPTVGSTMRIGGKPYLPVRIKERNSNSIDAMVSAEGGTGEYEYLIIDNTIETKQEARDRATAELNAYKLTLNEGSFMSYTDGFKAGQEIRINSEAHGIDENFIINQVTTKMRSYNTFVYNVSVVTTKTYGIIEYLQQIIIDKTKEFNINPDEIIDVVESIDETIVLSDEISISTSHNMQTETITMADTFTAQSLDYDVEWVLGPHLPVDNGRVILLDSGYLS